MYLLSYAEGKEGGDFTYRITERVRAFIVINGCEKEMKTEKLKCQLWFLVSLMTYL